MKPERAGRCPTCHRKLRRSSESNRRYWALLHEIAERVTPNGQRYSAETWHAWAKSRWLGCDDVKLPNGKTLVIPRSSADLDMAEFGEYMDQVEAWAAERDVWLADVEDAA